MIYTLTLNPALDYVIETPPFKLGEVNRTTAEAIYYGGKGINVSMILKELGYTSTALGFIANFTGDALEDGLRKEGIHTDFIKVKEGMTRINVKLKADEESEINGMGPKISDDDLKELLVKLSALNDDDILIISGSIPKCLPTNTYEMILEHLNKHVTFIVDAEKDLLLKTLPYHPFLIKPNFKELEVMFNANITTDEEVIHYAKELQKLGARNVLVSMAKDGALFVSETNMVERKGVAKGRVVNSVGAGDSMVAGFLAGYLKTNNYAYALTLGTACGGATAFHKGLASKEQIEEVLKEL